MKLSLIICAHNEAKLLPDCLRYAVRTGYPWHEIIVVDNASTDETCRAALSGGAIYVREPRKGLPYARQRGFEAATGDILCYVDADTRMPERWPWRVAYRFRTGIDVLCVSGPQLYDDIPELAELDRQACVVGLLGARSVPDYGRDGQWGRVRH